MSDDKIGDGGKGRNGKEAEGMTDATKPKLDDEMKALLEKAADGYARRLHDGEKIGMSTMVKDFMSALMKKEREYFLRDTGDEANGFYSRTLQLAMGT